jgi:hypothetical protein
MSQIHNPETRIYEELGGLELEARRLACKRDEADAADRRVIEQQLRELEQRIERLKRRLRPGSPQSGRGGT